MTLARKTALVTGASGSLGRAIALELAHQGADLVLHAFTHRDNAEAVADEARRAGSKALVVVADMRRPKEVEAMVQAGVKAFGGIDILVNNAAVSGHESFLTMSVEEWDRVLTVNLSGMFLCSKLAAEDMVRRHRQGRIINIASRDAMTGAEFMAHVVTSKMGVLGLTRCLAHDLGEYGITVNAVAPGAFDVPTLDKWYPTLTGERIAQLTPMKRLGLAGEIGKLCAFLASDDAAFITGQVIQINGGLEMTAS